MSKTRVKTAWSSVSFGSSPIRKIVGGGIGASGKLLRFADETDMYSTVNVNVNGEPNAVFATADVAAVFADIAPGMRGIFGATLDDPEAESGRAAQVTLLNAVFDGADVKAECGKFAVGVGWWQSFSTDGVTTPLSFAVDPGEPSDGPTGKPDAVILPERIKRGDRMVDRVASIADIAGPILGVDRDKGERAYIRVQGGGKLFVSMSIFDTINFPRGHPREGEPRYHWILQSDGSEFGYTVPGAAD